MNGVERTGLYNYHHFFFFFFFFLETISFVNLQCNSSNEILIYKQECILRDVKERVYRTRGASAQEVTQLRRLNWLQGGR